MRDTNHIDSLSISQVRLRTRELARAANFYIGVLGLIRLDDLVDSEVRLGVRDDINPRIVLVEDRRSASLQRAVPGLYHVALLLPSRKDLGIAILALAAAGWRLDGASDHFVSEAVYLSDPDGNGIELYRDRPRDEWTWQDHDVVMGLDPFDFKGVVGEGEEAGESWSGMPFGTTIGHMHLQVSDVAQSREFYEDVVGLEVTNRVYPGAAFLSAGGYHHHVGLNAWNTQGRSRPDSDLAGLIDWTIELPHSDAASALLSRAAKANALAEVHGEPFIIDPDGLRLRVLPAPS